MEKFPIFEIETTENKITIHGAVGSIVFYDYDRAEAVKQYEDHFYQVQQAEAISEFAKNLNEATEKIKKSNRNLRKGFLDIRVHLWNLKSTSRSAL